jgi:hypothetical protein
MTSNNQPPFNWKIAIFSVVAAMVTAYGTVYSTSATKEVSLRQADTDRINKIWAQLNQVQLQAAEDRKAYRLETSKLIAENTALHIQIIALEVRLQDKDDRTKLNQEFIDSLPFPAWIKQQTKDGKFVMQMINQEYTAHYKVTKNAYTGKPDFAVHPLHIAAEYEINDLAVINSKEPIKTTELVYVDGKEIEMTVYNFRVEIAKGVYGVGGVSIPPTTND